MNINRREGVNFDADWKKKIVVSGQLVSFEIGYLSKWKKKIDWKGIWFFY